jgi:hypothetical protein
MVPRSFQTRNVAGLRLCRSMILSAFFSSNFISVGAFSSPQYVLHQLPAAHADSGVNGNEFCFFHVLEVLRAFFSAPFQEVGD